MSGSGQPAIKAFVAEIRESIVLGQVLISRAGQGYELRHVADRELPVGSLKRLQEADLRAWIDYTAERQFRPLKSSPNLSSGWVLTAVNDEQLAFLLNQFYPNAIADWYLVCRGIAPVTDYRPFTSRQTGMYRITTMLSDAQAAQVIRACCRFCLKQRLWSVDRLAPDTVSEKSLIPCLEPCALMLEFARKGMRLEQEEKVTVSFSPGDLASIKAALERAVQHPDPMIREADFGAEGNVRRMQLALEKLNSAGIDLANATEAE